MTEANRKINEFGSGSSEAWVGAAGEATKGAVQKATEGAAYVRDKLGAVDETSANYGLPNRYTPIHLAERILTSKSALEGERKQVTVLFCDIVGSTALASEIGAEAMHRYLDDFFGLALDTVHGYEGTINQFLGDGFIALFGAPLAHEDHPRRAVLAALEGRLQRA